MGGQHYWFCTEQSGMGKTLKCHMIMYSVVIGCFVAYVHQLFKMFNIPTRFLWVMDVTLMEYNPISNHSHSVTIY